MAVISNGIDQVQRLIYLCGFQWRIEQGISLATTVCMDCAGLCSHMPPGTEKMDYSTLSLFPGLAGMACQAHTMDIQPILILENIEWRLPGVFPSYSYI